LLLRGTHVTAAGVVRLKKRLPKLGVIH
jgi:hypothetical protein